MKVPERATLPHFLGLMVRFESDQKSDTPREITVESGLVSLAAQFVPDAPVASSSSAYPVVRLRET